MSRSQEMARFFVSGVVGTAFGFLTYRLVWWFLPEVEYRTTVAWVVNYNIAVARQHWLHCNYSFATQKTHFWSTLPRAYLVYATVLAVTTAFNALLVGRYHVGPDLAWAWCFALAMLINYPIVKKFIYTRPT